MRYIKAAVSFILLCVASSYALDGNELLKKIDENLMPSSYEAYRNLVNIEPDGRKKVFGVYTVKKDRDKMAMLFLSPSSEKGRTSLRLGENMWLYIPNVGKPIRITSLQSITGGVFNNADIMQVDYNAEYNVTRVEQNKDGYILHLKAKNRTVAYDRLKMWATKDEVLKKIECYSASRMLIKTLEFKNIKDFGNGVVRPSVVETRSPLYKGYVSLMVFVKVSAREFKDVVFTMNYMSKIEGLRK